MMGPGQKILSEAEETVEVLEVIEECESAYEDDDIDIEYIVEY